MELECLRCHQAGASDATIGVNAMIDALPIDGGDVRPAHVTIYDAADSPWVARRAVSDKGDAVVFPALAIFCNPTVIHQVMTSVRDGEIQVVLAVLMKNADSPKNQRDALYINRAVLRFLRRFADNANAAFRIRNGVQLLNPVGESNQGQVNQPWDKAVAIAATNITWLGRDTAA